MRGCPVSALRQTAVCGTCGWVGYADEQAAHRCTRRIVQMEQEIADLRARQADLEKQLTATLLALDIIRSAREERDMLTPGTTQANVIPLTRAARSSQVTAGSRRTVQRTPGRERTPVTVLPRRAPAGGVPA